MNRKSIALKIAAIAAIPVSILACNKNEPAEEGLQGEEIAEAKAAMEYDLEKDFEAQELLNQFAITTLSEEEPTTYEITAGLVLDEAEIGEKIFTGDQHQVFPLPAVHVP